MGLSGIKARIIFCPACKNVVKVDLDQFGKMGTATGIAELKLAPRPKQDPAPLHGHDSSSRDETATFAVSNKYQVRPSQFSIPVNIFSIIF
jgi:hypothetical protein